MSELTRRSLLLLGCGAVCAHVTGCGFGAAGIELPATVPAGSPSTLSTGSIKALSVPVAIARDSGGIYAMSLVCTHQSCDMSNGVTASSIDCGCHGSVFDVQGNVLRGPASQALPHFAVTLDSSGQMTVHTDEVVASSTRLNA